MQKVIMRFMGCKVILESDFADKTYQEKQIERAEKVILRVFEKEYHQPSDEELKDIVERDLRIKISRKKMNRTNLEQGIAVFIIVFFMGLAIILS